MGAKVVPMSDRYMDFAAQDDQDDLFASEVA